MRPQEGDVAAVKEDVSLGGHVDATDAIENTGLASAVGANDGEKVAGLYLEVHPR
jgi:hypothetical protein